MRCSRTEAPSLRRRYPVSPVLRASPPPRAARPDPHGLSVGAYAATGGASRVASTPLFHACRRHYPGGTGRCLRRSLPDPWQPSPLNSRVGFRIIGFEACSAFTRVAARMVTEPPEATLAIEVLQTMSLPPSSAPTVTGWSDSCRAGFAPAEDWHLFAAHCSASTTFAARVASYEDVTRHPQNDRTRRLGRIASRRHPTAGNRPREVTRSGSMPRHAACSDPEPDSPPRLVNHRGTAGTPRSKGGPQGPELLAEPRGGQRVTWWMRRPLPSAASRYLTIPPTAPVHPLRRRAGGPVFGVFSGSVT